MKLREAIEAHFNEPVLLHDRLARVIGYGEDKQDCYLICQLTRKDWFEKGQIIWHTCVGGYFFLDALKGQSRSQHWDDFTRLDHLLEMNGAPKQEKFLVKYEDEDPFTIIEGEDSAT